jgi:hypothetical protein
MSGNSLDQMLGGISANHDPQDPLPLLVAPTSTGKEKNTIRMELIPIACWKLNDLRFAFASSFLLPETRDEFVELSKLIKTHPGAPLSVFGHADPVGDDDFNKVLSGRRADSVYAVIIRDPERWERLYTAGGTAEGWGLKSVQQMLEALGFNPGPATGSMNPATKQAVEKFQRENGLTADGDPGKNTRAKLFEAYMAFLFPDKLPKTGFLAQGADTGGKGDVQGCSEFNPIRSFSIAENENFKKPENKAARDADNEVNRRVMVLLFRPGTSVPPQKWPCPRTSEGTAACKKRFWSDGETRRSPQQMRREFETTKNTFACRFYHRLAAGSPCEVINPTECVVRIRLFDRFARPLPFAPCLITEEGKAPRPMRASGGSGADGAIIAIRHPKVPSKINVKWSRPASSDSAGSPPPAAGDTFEFELDVTVEMPSPGEESTAMDRLRNLGYVRESTDELNIRCFQFHYKSRFPTIVADGTLNAPTLAALKAVHDAVDPTQKAPTDSTIFFKEDE